MNGEKYGGKRVAGEDDGVRNYQEEVVDCFCRSSN